MRKRAEVENTGKNEATGPRKPKDILGNKVSVKVSKGFRSCVRPLIYSHPAAFSRGNLGGWDQKGSSLAGFCMRDQFIFYFLFLLATSIQISKYLFFFFLLYPPPYIMQMFYSKIICSIIYFLRNARCLVHTKVLRATHSVS